MPKPNPKHTVTLGTEDGHIRHVIIDGTDIAHHIAGLTLIGRPQEAELQLTLVMPWLVDTTNLQASVTVGEDTANTLKLLGWTPPRVEPEEPEAASNIKIAEHLNVYCSHPERGDYGWSWGCWGDGDCKGHVSYDISLRDYAERKAREHLAEAHPATEPAP